MPDRPTATIICDASLDPATGLAGWAGWIKHGQAPGTFAAGALGQPVANSTEAEFKGIVNTLHLGLANGLIPRGSRVCVQCDNMEALRHVEPRGAPTSSVGLKRAKHHLHKLAIEHDLLLYTKHVKGHTHGPDGRHRVNNILDDMAKDEMRRVRDQHKRRA